MKYLILSISVLWLDISGIAGHSLSKVQLEKPSELVYKIKEDKDGTTLLITSPKLEKPTLREIIYYHIIERPYKKEWLNKDPSNEDQRAFEEIRRVFTNGPGFQYGRVKQTDPPRPDEKKNEKNPINDDTNQIDIRHGDIDATSNTDQGNIDFPQESQENKENVTSKRRKRDIRYETSVAKREKRNNNIQRVTGLSDLPSKLYMNQQPAFTNVPNSIDDMSFPPNKDEAHSIRVNGIMPGPMRPYGMDFTGNNGNYWNAHRPAEPISYHPKPNANSLPSSGIKKDTNGFPDRNSNPVGFKNQGNIGKSQGSRYPGYGLDPDSRESDDGSERSDESSRERGGRSGEHSGSRSGEDSGSRSGEDSGSSSREDSSSSERGYGKDSRISGERDSQEHKGAAGSKESDNKGNIDIYTDHKQETKKKFDQILSDLHNIFVKANATVIVPGNPNLVGSKDAVNDGAVNNDTKKANMISLLEGLFTNIIRNTIIVNNNVPVIQNPGVNTENDASNPDIPQKFHDNVDTTTNSEVNTPATDLNSFKDTTDNASNKTEDFKPDEIKPELENGTDSKNVGHPDEVTTFNVTKLQNNTDKEMNKNNTSVEEKINDKLPSSTEQPDKDKVKLNQEGDNKDDDKKSNKTADEKKTKKEEGDDSKKHVNATETAVAGLKDNDFPANNKDNNGTSENNTNLDKMVDLMYNEKFWKFMGDLSAKYLESLVERNTKILKEEISAQMQNYLKEHNPEADIKEVQPKKDEIPNKKQNKHEKDFEKANNVIEDTNEANTTEDPVTNKIDRKGSNKKDKDNKKDSENFQHPEANKDNAKDRKKDDLKGIVNVKSQTIYGNTVGNDKVTNIYVFYTSKNLDAIIKNIKDIVTGNNSTNIFNFEPHSNKHHKGKDDDDGKHKGNETEIKENPTNIVTDKKGNTVTELNTKDTVTVTTKKPFTNKDNDKNNNMNTTPSNITYTVTESTIEQPVTTDSNMSPDTTDSSTNSSPKIEASTRPNDVTTEIAHTTSSTNITIDANKEEVTTENANHETSTAINNFTDKGSNDVTTSKDTTPNTPAAERNNETTEAVTTESPTEKDNKNVAGKGENKTTDENAKGINTEVTTEPTKGIDIINGTTNSSKPTDSSTENSINKTTTEIPNKGTSDITDTIETSTTQIDTSTTKPNVTESKAENVSEPSGNLTSFNVATSIASDASVPTTEAANITNKAGNSTENPKTETTNSNNKNVTDITEKPVKGKNLTENDKSKNDTKITPEKEISLNKTSNSNEIESQNNKTTETPSTESSTEKPNSTENSADKNNTSVDLKPGNNTDAMENPKNQTNVKVTSENKPDKSANEHKDENSKDKSEDKKNKSEENKDKKKNSGNQSSTESSVDKDTSTKKSHDEATTEKKNS